MPTYRVFCLALPAFHVLQSLYKVHLQRHPTQAAVDQEQTINLEQGARSGARHGKTWRGLNVQKSSRSRLCICLLPS